MATQQEFSARPRANLWQDWVNLILAAWLFISPWVLRFAAPNGLAAWDAWIFAVVVGVLSIAALARNQSWEEWINLLVGVWLFFSPWILGFAGMPVVMWNFLIVGALMFVLAIWDLNAASAAPEAFGHR